MIDLSGKVALVTGGGRDIGREVCIRLAQQGAKVCLNYFESDGKGDETVQLINKLGGEALLVQGDMTNFEDVNELVSKCRKKFGNEIHILVNVVGGLVGRKTVQEMDLDFWDFVIKVNLYSAFYVTKAVLPFIPEGGAIVNFASQAARDGGGPGAIAYSSAKGAVLTLTRGLAKELGPKKIRVNSISPGMINTTFHDKFTKTEIREKVAAGTPLRREGEACEIADLVAYLVSDNASFVTGASVDINGGTYFI